jgi:hypothetical protein
MRRLLTIVAVVAVVAILAWLAYTFVSLSSPGILSNMGESI